MSLDSRLDHPFALQLSMVDSMLLANCATTISGSGVQVLARYVFFWAKATTAGERAVVGLAR